MSFISSQINRSGRAIHTSKGKIENRRRVFHFEQLESRKLMAAFSLLDLFGNDGGLVVSEFLYDVCDQSPLAEGVGEYAIITNTNTKSLADISGWQLDDDGDFNDNDGYMVPVNTVIPAGRSVVIAGTTQANWVAEYGNLPAGAVFLNAGAAWQTLANDGDNIGFGNSRGRAARYSNAYPDPSGPGQAVVWNAANQVWNATANASLRCGAQGYIPGTQGAALVVPLTGSAAGPNNVTTDIHYAARQVANQKATGTDLPTNRLVTGQAFVDTEWSGVAYHVDATGLETLWVVPDEEPRIEIYRLHASTYSDHDGNPNTPLQLQPIRTVNITGVADGPEGIAWMGGNQFAFVWEGLLDANNRSRIFTAGIAANLATIDLGQMNPINLNVTVEVDGNQNNNDGLEGVAYDPNFVNGGGQANGAFYVIKEKLQNQGVYRVNPNNGQVTPLQIAGFNNNTLNNAANQAQDRDGQLFADFSDIHFARNPAGNVPMLYITSEQGEEKIARVNLNTNAVDQLVTKLNRVAGANNNNMVSYNAFIAAVGAGNVQVQEIDDDEDVLMNDIEGIAIKPDGTEAFLVADDDLAPGEGGNDTIDYRWLVDRTRMARINLDGDNNTWRDIGDIDAIAAAILAGNMNAFFDLNNDGVVNANDGLYLVQRLMQIPIGDSNMDGHFSTADLVLVFGVGEYEDAIARNSTWADGDWNFDGDFTSADFTVAFAEGRYEG
jgi:hypothetical protein